MNDTIKYIESLSLAFGGVYTSIAENAREIEISSAEDVLSAEEMDYIVKRIGIKKKECYRNALLIAQYLGCEYCEGYVNVCFPIEHAFNRRNGKYFDLTITDRSEYVVFGEYSFDDALNAMGRTYGNVFLKKYNNNEREQRPMGWLSRRQRSPED